MHLFTQMLRVFLFGMINLIISQFKTGIENKIKKLLK